MRFYFIIVFACGISVRLFSQEIWIRSIEITGNEVTKERIIRREMLFTEGDSMTLEQLEEEITFSKYNLQNTRLFNFVKLNYVLDNNQVDVQVSLIERWYIWPIPLLEYAEPNLTTFLRNRDLSRVDYGGYLIYENFRGRREVVKAIVRQGFDKQYALEYTLPFINPGKTLGLYFRAGYNLNHTVTVITENNQRVFYSDADNYVRKQPYFTSRLTFRHKYFGYHTLGVHFHQYQTTDSVMNLYPNFLKSSTSIQQYQGLTYSFIYNKLDWIVFPRKGYYFSIDGSLARLTSQNTASSTHYAAFYTPLGNRWFGALEVKSMKNWWSEPPYYLMRALGYRDNLRGFDSYIIDGTDFFMLKSNVKFQWLNIYGKKLPMVKNEKFSTYFLYAFVAPFFDAGYVWWQNAGSNFLQNQWQYSMGLEWSFVTYYNVVMKLNVAYLSTGKPGWAIRVNRVF